MTIRDAITKLDDLQQNTYTNEEKIAWLSKVDTGVFNLVFKTHESASIDEFHGYGMDTDLDTALLIPEPFEDIYMYWMQAQIAYNNAEYTRYNNAIALYNTEYAGYCNWYNRTHMPKGTKYKFF